MTLCYRIQNTEANQLAKKRKKSIKLQGQENDYLFSSSVRTVIIILQTPQNNNKLFLLHYVDLI